MLDLTSEEIRRFWDKVAKTPACWLWTASKTGSGYGKFSVKRRLHPAHRVSWSLHYGTIPPGMFVLHRCDVPACVRPGHLRVGTPRENTQDMMQKGRHACNGGGDSNSEAKLTWDQVRAIRARYEPTRHLARNDPARVTILQLAAEFSIGRTSVLNIVNGTAWREC